MARNLAHKSDDPGRGDSENEEPTDGKAVLNRRNYVRMGATALVAAFGAGTASTGGVSAEENGAETYATDFSEYAQ